MTTAPTERRDIVAEINADGSEIVAEGGFNAIEQEVRGQIDVQIATARAYPRSPERFMREAMELATYDEETAAACLYALPRGRGRDRKIIEGPSVRLAEIVASSWGHMRTDARVIAEDDRFVYARAACWDMQTNVAFSVEVRRRITTKDGTRYNDDMISTTANAAVSIALRNAVFRVIPNALTQAIWRSCKQVASGNAATLSQTRDTVLEYFQSIGVMPDQIFAHLGIEGPGDIKLEHIPYLKGIATSIRDGEITDLDAAFPPAEDAPTLQIGGKAKSDGKPKTEKKKEEVPPEGRQKPKGRRRKTEPKDEKPDEEPKAEETPAPEASADAPAEDTPESTEETPEASEPSEANEEPPAEGDDDEERPDSVFDIVFNHLVAKHGELSDEAAEEIATKWLKGRKCDPVALDKAVFDPDNESHVSIRNAAKRARWSVYIPSSE